MTYDMQDRPVTKNKGIRNNSCHISPHSISEKPLKIQKYSMSVILPR